MCICPVLGLGPNCPACPACRVPSLTNAASSWPPAHVSPACRARPSAEPGGARAAHCQRSRNKGTSPTGAAVFAATTRVNLHSSMQRLLCAPGCSLDMPSEPAQKALRETHDELIILRWGKDVHAATYCVDGNPRATACNHVAKSRAERPLATAFLSSRRFLWRPPFNKLAQPAVDKMLRAAELFHLRPSLRTTSGCPR